MSLSSFMQSAAPRDRPYVLLNMSMSADGKIANETRSVHTFGSARDLKQLYRLRATVDAILSGARTIEDTGATLGNGGESFRRARLRRGLTEFPKRVVVSGRASISPEAPLWQHRFSPILLAVQSHAPSGRLRRLRGLADAIHVSEGKALDVASLLGWLHAEWGIRRLLVEGGSEVNGAFFKAGLVDEVNLTLCPILIGGRTAPTLADGEGMPLDRAFGMKISRCKQVGEEVFLTLVRSSELEPVAAPRESAAN
jgi:riboflavin-specific deaminase-like protein